jgi:hypothetical protein
MFHIITWEIESTSKKMNSCHFCKDDISNRLVKSSLLFSGKKAERGIILLYPMPDKCRQCENGRACINGRFCMKYKLYVEYLKMEICKNE